MACSHAWKGCVRSDGARVIATPARMFGIAPMEGTKGVSYVGSWLDPFAKGSPVSDEMTFWYRVKSR